MPVDPGTLIAGATAAGSLFGGGGSAQAQIPSDLKGPRAESIALLRYLLGYGADPGGGAKQGKGGYYDSSGKIHGGAKVPRGGTGLPDFGGDPTSRLESFFGKLGVPTSDLQRQSLGGISQFLNGPAPEQNALDAVNKILGANPGQGMLDALKPRFDQNVASANQQGPRFSSGNELLRARAVDDFNLLSQQALSQGVQQQLQAAQIAGVLGQGQFDRLAQAYGIGQQDANQQDIETQRRLGILMNLLGVQQSSTLGLPITQQPGFGSNLATAGLNAATAYGAFHPGGRPSRSQSGAPGGINVNTDNYG